jgi:predicted dehydrogenase
MEIRGDGALPNVRIAVIGGGAFGREHVGAYRAVAGVDLVAIVEPDAERRRGLQNEFETHGTSVFESVAEMLRQREIDAASVVTPGSSHLAVSRELMTNGIDVLIEKPFADSVADAVEISGLARDLGRICLPGHIMRHSPKHVALQGRVREGELGQIVASSLRRDRSNDHIKRFPGVHPVLLTGVHDIDLALWFTGQRVLQVSAFEHRDRDGNVDLFSATLRHENGAISTVQGAYLLPVDKPTDVDDQIDLYGESGHAVVRETSRGSSSMSPGIGVANIALVAELTHFASCISSGEQSRLCTPEEAVHVIEIAEAVVMSAADSGASIYLISPSLSISDKGETNEKR